MKLCSACKIEKELSEFHKDQCRKDGFQYRCKECRREDQRVYRQTNVGKEVHRRDSRKHRQLYPEKTKAHNAIDYALKIGQLTKQPCPCGETEVEGHHKDYSKPLDVDWLCTKCHTKLHRKE